MNTKLFLFSLPSGFEYNPETFLKNILVKFNAMTMDRQWPMDIPMPISVELSEFTKTDPDAWFFKKSQHVRHSLVFGRTLTDSELNQWRMFLFGHMVASKMLGRA